VAGRVVGRAAAYNAYTEQGSAAASRERAQAKAAAAAAGALSEVAVVEHGSGTAARAAVAALQAQIDASGGRLRPRGRVVSIIDQSARQEQFMGTLSLQAPLARPPGGGGGGGGGFRPPRTVWFKPFSKKVPRFLLIPFEQLPDGEDFCRRPESYAERIFAASVVSWEAGSRNPLGAAAVASLQAAVLAEIYPCDVCSCHEILRRRGRG
jgi:exoribonuclease R